MKYFVSEYLNIIKNSREIDKCRYDSCKKAFNDISQAIFLEEKFDIVLENYSEYEKDLLTIAWDSILFLSESTITETSHRDLITRRIINLLGTCNIYKEQWKKHIRRITNMSKLEIEKIDYFTEEIKDKFLGYRFCCELRNYATHFDLPVTLYMIRLSNDEDINAKIYKKSIVVPKITLSDLTKYKKMDNFHEDLKSRFGEKIDLRPLIREYVLGLSRINFKIREIISHHLGKSEKQIFKLLDLLSINTPSKKSSIYLIQQENGSNKYSHKTIPLGFIARRKDYIEKNNLNDSFLNFYSTNKI